VPSELVTRPGGVSAAGDKSIVEPRGSAEASNKIQDNVKAIHNLDNEEVDMMESPLVQGFPACRR